MSSPTSPPPDRTGDTNPGICPDDASVIRLVVAVPAGQLNDRAIARGYLFGESMAQLDQLHHNHPVTAELEP